MLFGIIRKEIVFVFNTKMNYILVQNDPSKI